MRFVLLVICLMLFGAGTATAEIVKLQTKDKLNLTADWFPPKGKQYGVIVALHEYERDRQSFAPLAAEAAAFDVGLLCIDLRGFGASAKQRDKDLGERVRLRDLSLFSAMHLDVAAAMRFLKKKGFGPGKTILLAVGLGASVGLDYAARSKGFHAAALVTPGKKYFGLDTMTHIKALGDRATLIVSTRQEAAAGANPLYNALPSRKNAVLLLLPQKNTHGAELFTKVKGLGKRLVEWSAIQLGKPTVE